MATSKRPSRTTHVPRTAVTSSARALDFVVLSTWMYLLWRFIVNCFKHWYLVAIILVWFLVGPKTSILILLLCPALLIAYVWLFNRHHEFLAILRATRLLISARRKWKLACEKAELNDGPKCPRLLGFFFRHPPKLVNERGTSLEFLINLQRVGITVNHLEENRDYIASTLGARRTRVVRLTPGVARFTVEWEKSVRRGNIAATSPNDVILPRVELDQDVLLELETSVLVVGKSGTGKSNLTWCILNELNDLVIPYNLYVIDPKKVELQELIDSPFIKAYADDIAEIDGVIDKFYDDMMVTFGRMTPLHLRRAPLGRDWPLNLLIIDEILMCDQARKGLDTNLAKVLIAGRAAGYIVIADSQLGQVDALSRLRDLFPQRICMQVGSEELVNAVLGPRSAERGARCTEITEAGVGYIFTDFAGSFMRFKLPFIQGVSHVAGGQVWRPEKKKIKLRRRKKGPCYTYLLYNRHGILLYAGKAFNPTNRISEHDDAPWYFDIDHGRTVIKKYPSEDAAFEAEQDNIENLHPKYNLVHNFKKPA